MERLSRYGRRMKLTLINTMTVASLVCIIAIPFLTKNLLKTEANYYSITINGMKVGADKKAEEVDPLTKAQQEVEELKKQLLYKTAEFENYVFTVPDFFSRQQAFNILFASI